MLVPVRRDPDGVGGTEGEDLRCCGPIEYLFRVAEKGLHLLTAHALADGHRAIDEVARLLFSPHDLKADGAQHQRRRHYARLQNAAQQSPNWAPRDDSMGQSPTDDEPLNIPAHDRCHPGQQGDQRRSAPARGIEGEGDETSHDAGGERQHERQP